MLQEKRRFSRIVFKVTAELSIEDRIFTADQIENLSVGGCLFPASGNFPLGTACKVVILLAGALGSPLVSVTGRIVRSDPDRVGVKFTGIDPDSLFHLHNILRFNTSDPDQIELEIDDHPGLI